MGIVFFCLSVVLFTLALLVATQFVVRVVAIARFFGGRLEEIPQVAMEEFRFYLTPQFQAAEQSDLQRRALPVMRSAIATRRRNAARKENCLALATPLIAAGIFTAAIYAAILAI